MSVIPRARNRVEYRIDLESPPTIEQVKLVRNYPSKRYEKRAAMLFRYGRPITGFLLSDRQIAKLRSGQGKLVITSKQIDAYNFYAAPYGH